MENISAVENSSLQELWDMYKRNQAVDDPAYTVLIVMYSCLSILGATGNTLVIISVIRKPAMRTPRNMFIVNLAIADLLLCTVTMPLTLMEILAKHFPLGNNVFLCKMTGILQAISVYVSTISITAIALDRYQVIVYPTKESLQLFGATLILVLIWIIAIILALPLFIIKNLKHHDIRTVNETLELNFCIENWPMNHGRAYYSIFSLIFQHILPVLIVSVAYVRISYKLRCRFAAGFVSNDDNSTSTSSNPNQKSRRHQLRGKRLQRTNILLGSIALIFFICWLPLNLYNLIADLSLDANTQSMRVIYAVCHMMGMSSACSNPILYGCLNENFWKEFKDILCIESRGGADGGVVGESQRLSLRKHSQKVGRGKPDLVTGATDYQPCNTVSTDMSMLTKC